MTALNNTATTLSTKGIREDLEDTIYRVAPTKTPFQNNISNGGKATNTYHEWQTEVPDAPSSSNYQLEGDDIGSSGFAAENQTSRVGNYCQIFRKTGLVSGTDEVVKKAGRASELNRQKVLKGIALRTDMEMTFLANLGSNAETAGVTPRKCAGLQAWLVTNTSNNGGSNGGFGTITVTAATPGANRTFTEALLKNVRATAFNNGATPSQCYVGASQKQQMSAFTGIASIRVEAKATEQATIIGAADVYVDDFGTISIIPHQYAVSNAAVLVDPAMVGVATLRGIQTETLAQTGDAEKFLLLAEKTLVVRNEKAHAVIRALS